MLQLLSYSKQKQIPNMLQLVSFMSNFTKHSSSRYKGETVNQAMDFPLHGYVKKDGLFVDELLAARTLSTTLSMVSSERLIE